MAIRLGDVEFALGADTKALEKSIQKLKTFGTTVEKAAKSQVEGAQKVATALRRQEKAITGNLQKVLSLNTNLRKSDFGGPLVKEANKAFRSYNTALTKTKVSTLDFQRANTKLNASLGKVKRQFTKLNVKNAKVGMDRLTTAFQNVGNVAVLVTGPLGGFAARMTVLTSIVKRGGLAWGLLIAGFAAGIFVISKIGSAIVTNARALNIMRSQLDAITGSTALTNLAFKEIIDISNRSGQSLKVVGNQYAKFNAAARGTGIAGGQVKKIFTDVALTIGKLQLPAEQAQGIFKALEQIMSKGTVQAEELRNQLGDRLPGAFNIAARAMKVNTKELGRMLKAGELLSNDFLPKFARELRRTFNIGSEIKNLQASFNRVATSMTLFLDKLDKLLKISSTLQKALDRISAGLDILTKNVENLGAALGALAGAIIALKLGAIITGLRVAAGATILFAKSIGLVTIAMLANPVGALINLIGRLAIVIAGATAGYFGFKAILGETADEQKKLSTEVRDFNKLVELTGTGLGNLGETIRNKLFDRLFNLRMKLVEAKKALSQFNDSGAFIRFVFLDDEATLNKKITDLKDKISGILSEISTVDISIKKADLSDLNNQAENTAKVVKTMQTSINNSFDSVGNAIGDMVAKGKLDLESFSNVTRSIVADIIKTMLQLTVVNRLKNTLFSLTGAAAFPVLGGSPATAAAKGAIVSGPVTKMAKGGIVNGPTMFNTAGGNVLAGEAGAEAIIPLKRDSSGRLGIGGGGRGTNITINISTPSPEAFKSSEGQIAGAIRRAVAAGNRSM